MDNKKCQKNIVEYVCHKCHFKCSKKSNWRQHLTTRKHNLDNLDNKMDNDEENEIIEDVVKFSCICGKEFKYQSGLCKHKKKCQIIIQQDNSVIVNENDVESCSSSVNTKEDYVKETSIIHELINQNKELRTMLIEQHKQHEEAIKEIIPKIGNTINNNQQYTIQMFLNDKCKNALNISDFINSLQITLEDLNMTTNRGLIEGVTLTMMRGLEKLQLHERPIHCSDLKREIMYIKDDDEWNRDSNHNKLKTSIETVADKQLQSFQKWEEDNPGYMEHKDGQEKYLQFMGNATIDLKDDPKKMNKIIKNVSKEVYLTKDTIS